MAASAYLAFEPEDQGTADIVAAELERNGWTIAQAGAETRNTDQPGLTVQTVAGAKLVVAVLSPAAEASQWVRREIIAALNNGRTIVSVLGADLAGESWFRSVLDVERAIDARRGLDAEALGRIIDQGRAIAGRTRVIAMLNIKGGVGKTVLAANLFAAAHLVDKRAVSFIDLDPQHNLTQYFLGQGERNRIRTEGRTIYSVLVPGPPVEEFQNFPIQLNRTKRGKNQPRFDLIAGDERLFEFTLDTRRESEKAQAFTRFRALISYLRARTDAVVIDANPCATFLTRLAITAADHIVAPVRPEQYSLTGLNMLEHVVREVRGRPLRPGEFSVLLNGVSDRTSPDPSVDADALTRAEIGAAPFFGSALLEEAVPYAGALRAAPSERFAVNPINVTAMMRVGGRSVKQSLAHAAASILRRADV